MQQSVDEMKRQLEKVTTMINQALQGDNLNDGAKAIDPALPVKNQDIIIVGGWYAPGEESVSNTAETFNIVEGNSTQLPSMNIARGASASCVYNGDVIVTGGYDGKNGTDSIEILKMNQQPLRWTIFDGKLPVKLSAHAVIVYQDKLYVVGGYNFSERKASDHIYELTLTPPYTSKLLVSMPQPRCDHSAVVVNGHLYVIGGTTASHRKDAIDSVVVYDFIKNEIKSCPSIPKPLCRMSTVSWGNTIVVLGGRDKNDNVLNDAIMYDTEAGQSERLPSLRQRGVVTVQSSYMTLLSYWEVGTRRMGVSLWEALSGESCQE